LVLKEKYLTEASIDMTENIPDLSTIIPPEASNSVFFKSTLGKEHINRVLLFNPPTDRSQFIGTDNYFPLGLISLATVLRSNGDVVEVIDTNNAFFNKHLDNDILENHLHEVLLPYIKKFKPDLIGIGGTFSGAFKYTKFIGQIIKNKYPEIPIIVGGNHASTFKGLVIKRFQYIDYVLIGEGECTFPEFLECIIHNNGVGIEKIDGLCYRKGGHRNNKYDPSAGNIYTPEDQIIVQEKLRYIDNLHELPHANYDVVDVDSYYMDTSNWHNPHNIPIGQPYPIISSRSCPMRCTFCNMWHVHGPKIRDRTAMDVVDEIENLYNKYGARYFQFMDDNFTWDEHRVISIMNEIVKRGLKIQFDTPNGIAINRLDPKVIKAMVDGGLTYISIAIESGSEEIRQIMKKGLGQEEIYAMTHELAKYEHVFIKGFFIIGMPEETHETLEATRKVIKELPLDKFSLNYATPFPGTALFNQCKASNLLNYDVEDYVEIDGHQLRSDRPHFAPYNLSEKDLMDFMDWGDSYSTNYSRKKDPRGAGDINIPNAKNLENYWKERIKTS
jgi:magnesium-protoporphyrin IX monomethyl ester (oxidative) cyclase